MTSKEKSKLEQVLDIIQKEPNYEVFEYRGYKVVIKRMMYLGGQLNGYVRIPKAHKYYQKGYDDIPIECHGGLTFAGDDLEEDGDWYIGFDTAHYGDYMPFMQMQFSAIHRSDNIDETYKDINYVRNECKHIIKQLIGLE